MEARHLKKEINRLKKRYYILQGIQTISFALLFFSFFIMLILGFSLWGRIEFDINITSFTACLISLTLGFLWVNFSKKTFLEELVRTDHRLKFRDRLSTAYECCLKKKSGKYVDLLIKDAQASIKSIGIQKILPLNLPKAIYFLPVFVILSIVIYYNPFSSIAKETIIEKNPQMLILGHQIESFGQQMYTKAEKPNGKELHREILKTAQKIMDSSHTSDDAMESLTGLLEVIKNDFDNQLERMEEKLNFNDSTRDIKVPSQGPNKGPSLSKTTAKIDLKELEEKIKEAFDDEIPNALSNELSDLENSLNFRSFLKNTIRNLENDSDRNQNQSSDLENGNKPSVDDDPSRDSVMQENGNRKKSSGEIPSGYYSGDEKSGNDQKMPEKIKANNSAAFKDKGLASEKNSFKYAIKALSAIGVSTKTEKEIQKEYIKQKEAVLLKEQIPAEFKETIKDYFLSIGLDRD